MKRRLTETPGFALMTSLLGGIAGAAAIYGVGRAAGVLFNVSLLIIVCLVAATLVWASAEQNAPVISQTDWPDPQRDPTPSLRSGADWATRNLADTISGAQPSRGSTSTRLGEELDRLARARCRAAYGTPPDAPLSALAPHLGPDLTRYLERVEDDDQVKKPTVTRRALRSHLRALQSIPAEHP